jgi:hypothetical protein
MYPNWDFWFEIIPSGNPDNQAISNTNSKAQMHPFLFEKLDIWPYQLTSQHTHLPISKRFEKQMCALLLFYCAQNCEIDIQTTAIQQKSTL